MTFVLRRDEEPSGTLARVNQAPTSLLEIISPKRRLGSSRGTSIAKTLSLYEH